MLGTPPAHFPRAFGLSKGPRSPAGTFLQRLDGIAGHLQERRSQWWEVERWLGADVGDRKWEAAECQVLSSSDEKEHSQAKVPRTGLVL